MGKKEDVCEWVVGSRVRDGKEIKLPVEVI